jgi:5,5'-dehydrodivanillate O-demethylase
MANDDQGIISEEKDFTDFAYTGPDTLAGQYMRKFWQPVYRSQDVPAGRAIPVRIMNEDFTLYRGKSNQPHLTEFRCPHRGTQLSAGWVEDDCIRCFYHGWKFDQTGQCVEQPAEQESFAKKIRIRTYPTQDYLGLIFAYLGEGEPPPFPRYPDWDKVGVNGVRYYIRKCNFFQYIENHCDPIHTPFVHRNRWIFGNDWKKENLMTMTSEEMEWGLINRITEPDGRTWITAMGLPNVHEKRQGNPHRVGIQEEMGKLGSLTWNVPIDDETGIEFTVYAANSRRRWATDGGGKEEDMIALSARATELSEKVLAGKMTISEAETIAAKERVFATGAGANVGLMQDAVAQVGQARIVDRRRDHLGRSDVGVILFRKLWSQELNALAEGLPLHQWHRPEWLQANQ